VSQQPDPISAARQHSAERKATLVDLLRGRAPQPRDAAGRVASPNRSTGFDGGAREPAPEPVNPVADHDQVIVSLALASKVGGYFGW
jgi:hypothetical protein